MTTPPAQATAAVTEGQTLIANEMSEADLQSNVIKMARQLGYMVYHTKFSVGSQRGFPDLVLVPPDMGFVLFVELKRQNREPTAIQQTWLDAIAEKQTEVRVWKPMQWLDGTVEAVLRGETYLP